MSSTSSASSYPVYIFLIISAVLAIYYFVTRKLFWLETQGGEPRYLGIMNNTVRDRRGCPLEFPINDDYPKTFTIKLPLGVNRSEIELDISVSIKLTNQEKFLCFLNELPTGTMERYRLIGTDTMLFESTCYKCEENFQSKFQISDIKDRETLMASCEKINTAYFRKNLSAVGFSLSLFVINSGRILFNVQDDHMSEELVRICKQKKTVKCSNKIED